MTDKTRSILASYALKKSEAAAKEKADRAEKEAKKVKGLGLVDIRKFFTPKTPRAPTAAEIEVPADATAMSNDEILEFIADLKNVHGIVDPEAPSVRKSKFETQGMLSLCFMLCACDFCTRTTHCLVTVGFDKQLTPLCHRIYLLFFAVTQVMNIAWLRLERQTSQRMAQTRRQGRSCQAYVFTLASRRAFCFGLHVVPSKRSCCNPVDLLS